MSESSKTTANKTSAKTSSGIPVEVVYRAEDIAGADTATTVGEPGAYPFTRGIQPTMYRGRLWTMRQYAGMG
ncbi:MAG: methylmalonyl-CoA mutase family protein, partial [Edaphobacter sp.]